MSALLQLLSAPRSTRSYVDTVTVELHNAASPYNSLFAFNGILQTNGNVVCTFPGTVIGNSYYIVIKHRNSIETWSAAPVTMTNGGSYSFSSGAGQAYGSNMIYLGNSIYGIYSGD